MKIFSNSIPIVANEFEDTGVVKRGVTVEDSTQEDSTNMYDDSSEESEDDNEDDQEKEDEQSYIEEKVEENGRIRRRVVFKNNLNTSSSKENENSYEEEEEEQDENRITKSSDANKNNVKEFTNKKNLIKEKIETALSKLKTDRENDLNSDSDSEFDETENEDDSGLEGEEFKDDYESENDYETDKIDCEERRKRKVSESEETQIIAKKSKPWDENFGFESSALKWKENLAQKASDAFLERQNNSQNLYKLVYGRNIAILIIFLRTLYPF